MVGLIGDLDPRVKAVQLVEGPLGVPQLSRPRAADPLISVAVHEGDTVPN